jgi:hypothetical protein
MQEKNNFIAFFFCILYYIISEVQHMASNPALTRIGPKDITPFDLKAKKMGHTPNSYSQHAIRVGSRAAPDTKAQAQFAKAAKF